ncbi:cyclodeaminase/cyclohydrolase family protein [Nocardioides sp. cx-169]|uniref:cyclodeaminase/cyclohydrolase family protein n=1 Tax=Nocardioides sp. cx-169 TaxID=2899080 RepID=UPI001E3BBCFA|nr:cyclodeaminase/cyclohydrolase family protein [Nocardioides sp. cx-169]MCD4534594.1 cyclodeaminase/cyclohydrolase family protein [Nocardioides sp. cx-169]
MVHDAQPDTGTVTDLLDRLAARTPTPAGGSVAALCTAQAAALVAMVARYCELPDLVERADRLVVRAQQLMVDDERAFAAVAEAWARPRGVSSPDEERRDVVSAALLGASEPQAQVVETAVEVLVLIDRLRPAAKAGLLADLVAAGEVARAGCAIARMNVGSNLRGLPESEGRSRLLRRMGVAKERA